MDPIPVHISKEYIMDKQSLTRLALSGMMAGGLFLTACEKSSTAPVAETTKTGITAAKTVGDFQAECTKIGGAFSTHDCNGMNSCKGHSFQEGEGVASHDCAGHSSCKGGSCLES
jgi:hypothetical protein